MAAVATQAAAPAPFDVGPLTWVKTEIDHSLNEARQHLDKVTADPTDAKSLKFVQTHLHQVTGALSMVGLGTATRFNEEIEKAVAVLETDTSQAAALTAAAKKGMVALANYLDNLIGGYPNRPMVLAATYVELSRARGSQEASESDLFYPDLSASLASPEDTVVMPTKEMLEQSLKQKRAAFQAGLLKLLRDKDFVGGLRLMKDAVLGVEALQLHSPSRTFWFTAGGFLDAVALSGNEQRSVSVALFGKIDQQIKTLQEGNQKVPERLYRDLLLVIGKCNAHSGRVKQVKDLFRLDDLLATGDKARGDDADEAIKAVLRTLRELTAAQKESWLKFTSGNRSAIDAYVKQAEQLVQTSAKQANADLTTVLKALGSVGVSLRASAVPTSETVALEVATAMLFVENAIENYFRLTPEFGVQAKSVATRVTSAMAGVALPALDPSSAGLMDDMSKRAQERLLIFQVGQEVQVNLQNIEQVLDNYFRDPLKAGELPPLAGLFAQTQGALAILDLNEAAGLNQLLARRVAEYASGARKGEGEDAEAVAEGVSALGLYIGALQQGQSNPRDTLLPALIRFGLAEKPAEPKAAEKASVSDADIEQQKQKAQELFEEWKQKPEMTATRDQLKQAVEEIRRDAELVADRETAQQSAQALSLLETAEVPTKTGLHEALQEIAPATPVTPVEPPTQQVVQLLDKESAEVDAELLEIFLEEASEVVGTINENLEIVRTAPSDKEALTTIRRGFHTLKGSGRMVGLTDLGEVAWQVEQVMNKWLKEEKPATPSLLRFLALASDSFGRWVSALKESGQARIDGTDVTRIAEALKNDKEPNFGDAPAAVAAAPAAVVAPAPAAPEPKPVPAPEPAPVAAAEPPPVAAAVVQEDDGIIRIGGVEVYRELFDIYLEEARDHVATLRREMASLEAQPMHSVTHEFMRAAHTLTGSSNTTGFVILSRLAHALEDWLKTAIEFGPQFDAARLGATRNAVDALSRMVEQLSAREEPLAREDLAMALDDMRGGLLNAQRVGEDTLMRTGRFYGLEAEAPSEPPPPKVIQPPGPIGAEEAAWPAEPMTSSKALEIDSPTVFMPVPDLEPLPVAKAPEPTVSTPASAPAQLDTQAFDFLKESVPEVAPEPAPVETPAAAAPPFEMPALDLPETPAPAPEQAPAALAADTFSFLDKPAAVEPAAIESVPTVEEKAVEEEAFFADEAPAPAPADEVAAVEEIAAVETIEETSATEALPPIEEPAAIQETVAPAEQSPIEVEQPRPAVEEPAFPAAAIATAAAAGSGATVTTAPGAPALPAQELALPAGFFEAGKEKRRIQDDIDQDLLPIFLEEAKEIVPQVGDALRTWKGNAADHTPVVELARHMHTLKGSARMAGLMRLGELSHLIETQIIEMDREGAPGAARFDRVEEYWDRFTGSLDRLEAGEELLPAIEVPVSEVFEQQKDKPGVIAVMAAAAAAVREEVQLEGRERQALLRVNADMIDRFVNEAGELAITRSRIDGEMVQFKRALVELTDNVTRMRGQLREIEIEAETAMSSRIKERDEHSETFDPLEFDRFSRMQEVTRFLAESLHDVITLQQGLQKNLDEAEAALTQQGRLNRDLQQGLMGVRLVPLGNLQDRLYRVVRQTAKELGKKANLEFRGARVELDRSVLEKITAPFEHLLRNAVAHGLETPDKRADKGKAEIGEITIDANQVGNEVVLIVTDDGNGLNYPRIRERAIEAGLLDPAAETPDEQLAQFIFMPGFSTATEVTQIAGRGVGMDVVKNEIVSLGGRIEMSSVTGKGTTFTITLPLTLAVTQAVMVRVGEVQYAIPSVMVEQVQEYKGKKYETMVGMSEIDWKGNRYPFRSMELLLGGQPTQSAIKRAYAILAKSGTQRAAVQVDEIIGNREVVVKQIGPQLARLPGVAGATVLGNGQVVLILNPVQLVFRETATLAIETSEGVAPVVAPTVLESASADGSAPVEPVAEAAPVRANPLVMVVDDSLTVRKITSRMLTREGYEVATAKDGVDGLKQLQDIHPDIILLDIEMPRMDGFEFARNVRADARMGKIPIIMITSRTADKHRNHAMEIGVNEYMGKPYQEDQLLALIRNYVGESTSRAGDTADKVA
jgi:chemosensory pili system protein ChpA (sensor histidine kinase/response regulator)